MKAYIATTGVLFLLLTGARLVRVVGERHLARDPFFVVVTLIALALSVWSLQLLRKRVAS